ncbi:MAG: hypothetical protein MJ252_00780 [archaeon]|nr:hypothetical protein [archaeon]
MYKGEFPVPGQALGYYVNCLERDVKFNLYIINNQLYKFQNGEKELPKPDEADATRLQNDLNKLINCEAVYKVVPTLENEFCKKGINWMYLVIQLFIWLLVSMIFLGVAIGRIEILVWRKKKEIESMMESMEVNLFYFNFLGCLLKIIYIIYSFPK